MPPEAVASLLVWICAALLLCTAAAAAAAWALLARVKDLARPLAHLQGLEELRASVARLASERSDIDLRRIEHVLIEMRDANRRLEDALLRIAQTPRAPGAPEAAGAGGGLAERLTTRLFAQGYERIQILTSLEELARIGDSGDGEVRVEARRDGAPCKGRVVVRGGMLADVEMQSAYAIFP